MQETKHSGSSVKKKILQERQADNILQANLHALLKTVRKYPTFIFYDLGEVNCSQMVEQDW